MKKTVLAILLSTATIIAGPIACTSANGDKAAYTLGTDLGISKEAMDTSVKPGEDFYAYANGNWQKVTQIPADRSSIGAFSSTMRLTKDVLAPFSRRRRTR